ncbi:MAG: hypothetical protein J5533_06900 [Bacteroidales bacterium]|nr:hypothetical protein [Bacteroidales bacterium]
MVYDISLPLSPEWIREDERYEEVDNAMITHAECHLPSAQEGKYEAVIDLYAGDMPSDTTAEDEAYANYAEIIGWDEEDEEDNPIAEWRFQKRKAYGFTGECEDGSIMLLMCVEIVKGGLLICSVVAANDEAVSKWAEYLEANLKVTASN